MGGAFSKIKQGKNSFVRFHNNFYFMTVLSLICLLRSLHWRCHTNHHINNINRAPRSSLRGVCCRCLAPFPPST